MRTWVKATLGGLAVIVLGFAALAGTGTYLVLRNLDKRAVGETESIKAIDAVKARFGARPPLVEIIDPRRVDIRINRPAEPSASPVSTVHIMSWQSDSGEMTRAEVPLWLMRFSSVNLLSQLGVAPEQFRLTVSDIEHYGPGILADYGAPGTVRVLVWVE